MQTVDSARKNKPYVTVVVASVLCSLLVLAQSGSSACHAELSMTGELYTGNRRATKLHDHIDLHGCRRDDTADNKTSSKTKHMDVCNVIA